MKSFLSHINKLNPAKAIGQHQLFTSLFKLKETGIRLDRLTPLAGTVETSRSIASNSPSQPKDRKNWQRLARNWGVNCVWLIGSIGLSQLAIAPSAQAATSTLNFSSAPILVTPGTGANISGTGVGTINGGAAVGAGAATVYRVGDVYRFTNVFSGIDALITIQGTVGGATLRLLDDPSVFPNRFQPIIGHPGTPSSSAHIQFDVQLVLAGTSTPATAINVYFSAQDVDGAGAANSTREYVGIKGAQSTVLANPTLLQPFSGTPPIPGFVTYEQRDALNVQAGIGIGDQYEFYSFIAASAGSFSIIGGNTVGSAGCGAATTTNIGSCQRQNSYTFDANDVQRLDFGDAPQVYGDAFHAVPPTTPPAVRLGANVSGDDAPVYNNTDTFDDGVASFPQLSTATKTYALNVSCAGTGTFVAGWIDFNRNGTFDPGERASGTCNGTTVALNWTGISGVIAGQSYARFRISSIDAEVANPTGAASNGEVEDYPLTINLKASVLLVKRITAINGLTTNDGINLAAVVDSTATTNDDPAKKWPTGYLAGAVDAGRVKPGDTIEYTIYYLNNDGATTTSLKICDPINGKQTYFPNSIKLLPGGATAPAGILALTDAVDLVDRANSYTTAPNDCNAINSTAIGANRGGVAIQLIGPATTNQPNLPNIPAATAAGSPIASYGWFRFTTKVDP